MDRSERDAGKETVCLCVMQLDASNAVKRVIFDSCSSFTQVRSQCFVTRAKHRGVESKGVADERAERQAAQQASAAACRV